MFYKGIFCRIFDFMLGGGAAVSVRSVAVFGILWAVHFAYKKAAKKAPSPIGMIVLAAGLGIVFWGI